MALSPSWDVVFSVHIVFVHCHQDLNVVADFPKHMEELKEVLVKVSVCMYV